MKTPWFAHWGWVYRPVHLCGGIVTLAALAFCANVFVGVDRHAHSVGDTLYGVYPFVAPTFLGLMWIAAQTSGETKK